jgi:hypothetical protein
MKRAIFILCTLLILASVAQAVPLKMEINEWNCVSASKFLAGGTDTYFGAAVGNGDNWIELAVIEDHLDIRNWGLQWDCVGASGSLTFSNSSIWSDLRKGTIIGLHENDVDNDLTGGIGEVASDTSYNPFGPFGGDWTILASINDAALISKTDWKVNNDNWEGRILDASSNVIQDYVGEPTSPSAIYKTSGGLGSDEVGALIVGPRVEPGALSYKDKSTSSTFLSPNVGQDFTAMRNEVLVPEPGTVVILLSGLLMACVLERFRRNRFVA